MDAVVVDASALASVAFGEPGHPRVERRLKGRTLYAPRLLHLELANIALTKARRDADNAALIIRGFAVGYSVPIELVDPPTEHVLGLALGSGLSCYDASYLWLAMALQIPLVTLDMQLDRAAKRAGL
jgi:predicted nucleic acid-binding protein